MKKFLFSIFLLFSSLSGFAQINTDRVILIGRNSLYYEDYVLAIQILRSEFQIEKELGQLSSYLENRGLIFSAAAAKYELGYYDEDILASLDGNIEAFDDMIGKWKEQPVLDIIHYFRRGSSRKSQHRDIGQLLPDLCNLQIRRTEIISPLGNTVTLVDHQQTNLHRLEFDSSRFPLLARPRRDGFDLVRSRRRDRVRGHSSAS